MLKQYLQQKNISMDELYELCTNQITIYLEGYSAIGTVNIKNKKYVLKFRYQNKEFTEELCPVKRKQLGLYKSAMQNIVLCGIFFVCTLWILLLCTKIKQIFS